MLRHKKIEEEKLNNVPETDKLIKHKIKQNKMQI